MSSKIPKGSVLVYDYSCRSDANNNLAAFLIFLGVVGAVPLYHLFSYLVLRRVQEDWIVGGLIGLALVLYGVYLYRYSRKHFRVFRAPNQGGSIEVRDGLRIQKGSAVSYDYSGVPVIRLQPVATDVMGLDADRWEVSLIDGRREYLLDAQVNRLQESRNIAELLAKSIGCKLNIKVDHTNSVDIEPGDLDLPFNQRVHKYPALLGPEPQRPEHCSVEVKNLDGDTGRSYTWGVGVSGQLFTTLFVFALVIGVSCLPLFGNEAQRQSMFDMCRDSGNYFFYICLTILLLVVLTIQYGFSVEVSVRGEKIFVKRRCYGFTLTTSSILLDSLEEISDRDRSSGVALQLISDMSVISLNISDMSLANYVTNDLRHFIALRPERNG